MGMKVIPKPFSESQVARLADMSSDFGMVLAASVAIPSIFGDFSGMRAYVGGILTLILLD